MAGRRQRERGVVDGRTCMKSADRIDFFHDGYSSIKSLQHDAIGGQKDGRMLNLGGVSRMAAEYRWL